MRFIDPDGMFAVPPDDYYINRDGSIRTVKTDDSYDRFFIQTGPLGNVYTPVAQLEKNEAGLVEFPSSGDGFTRYGIIDAGGQSTSPMETVGEGDHFLNLKLQLRCSELLVN